MEHGIRPLLPNVRIQRPNSLVVVIANSLELVMKIGEPDVIIHRGFVNFHNLDFSAEDGRLDEFGAVMHDGFLEEKVEFGVLF